MVYSIRNAREEDLREIEKIYSIARAFMQNTGNPTQWGTTYPPRELLEEDVKKHQMYAVEAEGRICGVFAFIPGVDPTYLQIYEGAWRSEMPYGAIHRVASDGSGGVFGAAVAFCRSRMAHLRIDTHENNRVMQHTVEKHGFSRRGIIYLEDGSPRIAYDWLE